MCLENIIRVETAEFKSSVSDYGHAKKFYYNLKFKLKENAKSTGSFLNITQYINALIYNCIFYW